MLVIGMFFVFLLSVIIYFGLSRPPEAAFGREKSSRGQCNVLTGGLFHLFEPVLLC